jgi:phosphate transport system permease protein
LSKKASRHVKERIIESLLFAAAAFSVFVTLAIVYVLVKESWVFFEPRAAVGFPVRHAMDAAVRRCPLRHHGAALGHPDQFGVALLVAIPLGTIIALYLSEFAGFKVREIAKPFLELLGGVPTIVYGYFALTLRHADAAEILSRPARLQPAVGRPGDGHHDHSLRGSLSEDAMRAVPMNAARGLLRHGRDAPADRPLGGHAGGDFGHRLGLHPRHLPRGRRNHDPRGRRRHAAQPDLQSRSSRERPSPPTSCRWRWATCRTAAIGYQTIFAAGLTLLLMTLASTCSATGCASASARCIEMNAEKLQRIRAIITRAKRWDLFFGVIGMLSLMVGVLTFTVLFVDMAIQGCRA